MQSRRRFAATVAPLVLSALALPLCAAPAPAQSLRGSRSSIDRMYRHAVAENLHFYETVRGVRNAARQGTLVRLDPDANFILHAVSFPFVKKPTRTFVRRLAEQYHDVCGEQLVVTSATRPEVRQPSNSTPRSVHPTGIAVDLRKPDGKCLEWLRGTLLDLEEDDLIEVTEEFGPPHFHVAVFPTPYRQYVAARTGGERRSVVASSSAERYRVREGDTLWDIARTHDTSVRRLKAVNHLAGSKITPGQELVIPAGDVAIVSASGSAPR